MVEVLKRLGTRPGVTTELMIATLFTNLLALASPLFVIQVLNRYVTFGVDATLRTLVFGVLIAIVLEFGFREIRMRLAQGLAIKPDEALALAVFGTLTAAKSLALEQVPLAFVGKPSTVSMQFNRLITAPISARSLMCRLPCCFWVHCTS